MTKRSEFGPIAPTRAVIPPRQQRGGDPRRHRAGTAPIRDEIPTPASEGSAAGQGVTVMFFKRLAALGLLALTISGCAVVDTPTRAASLQTPGLATTAPQTEIRDYRIEDINVRFPEGLRISEANSFYPLADIVWRGDPYGDRLEQIQAIFVEAFEQGTAEADGAQRVDVDILVKRFHSLTERTRYSVGGTHSIKFEMTVRDAATGEVLEGPRMIDGDLVGLGGQAAIAAEREGRGQKWRIIQHLSMLAERQLGLDQPV